MLEIRHQPSTVMNRPRYVLLKVKATVTLREPTKQFICGHGDVPDVRRADDQNDMAVRTHDPGSFRQHQFHIAEVAKDDPRSLPVGGEHFLDELVDLPHPELRRVRLLGSSLTKSRTFRAQVRAPEGAIVLSRRPEQIGEPRHRKDMGARVVEG